MQSMREETAILEFMAVGSWIERLLQIAEEFADEEVTITVLRSLKLIFRSDAAFDRCTERYPSMGEFLTQMINAYVSSQGIMNEGISALDILLRRPHYIRLIDSKWVSKLQSLKTDPRLANLRPTIDSIINKLKQK